MHNCHSQNKRLVHAMQCVSNTRPAQKTTQRSQSWPRAGGHMAALLLDKPARPHSPHYDGISIPYTSLSYAATCAIAYQWQKNSLFFCLYSSVFGKLHRMSFIPRYSSFAWGSRARPNWVLNVPGSQHSWKLWIASPCMPDRLYIKLSQEPWGLEKYSSISRPIGQWSLTHASFNITMINKGRKQILKTWLTAHCLLGWQFWPKVLYVHPPQYRRTHKHTRIL